MEKLEKIVGCSRHFNNRGAIWSVFDGRYRFSRYFSPLHFNRPTTYHALVANNDLEVFELQQDPEETQNLAQDGTAKGELMVALDDKLNARIDEEVGEDNGKFLARIGGYWSPAFRLLQHIPRSGHGADVPERLSRASGGGWGVTPCDG